jgi:hypothetical protein
MSQSHDSKRNASLDQKKERAAGRKQHDPAREAIRDAGEALPAKGRTAGAFGGKPDPQSAITGAMQDKDAPRDTPPSRRRPRKRR